MLDQLEAQVALAAARAGGMAALAERRALEERKLDGSPVSAADRAADAAIAQQIQAAFPSDTLLSEERAEDPRRLHCDRVWIVDPIDGTRSFLDGCAEWSVHVALAVAGHLHLGVVGLPEQDLWLLGIPGRGCYQWTGETPARVVLPQEAQARVLLSRRLAGSSLGQELARVVPGYALTHQSSVGGKVAALLAGRACHYLHPLALQEWDIAAPAAVFLGAGGLVSALGPGGLRMNLPEVRRPHGFVFSLPGHGHEALVARARAVSHAG